jgi:hypothetical protein
MKVRPLTAKKSCLEMLRAPPLRVQKAIVEVIERADPVVQPALMASLVEDRVDDAKFIIEHQEEIVTFSHIFSRGTIIDPSSEGLDTFDPYMH